MEKSYNALKNSSAGAVPMFLVSTADELREDTAAEVTPDTAAADTGAGGEKNKKKKKQSNWVSFVVWFFFHRLANNCALFNVHIDSLNYFSFLQSPSFTAVNKPSLLELTR